MLKFDKLDFYFFNERKQPRRLIEVVIPSWF